MNVLMSHVVQVEVSAKVQRQVLQWEAFTHKEIAPMLHAINRIFKIDQNLDKKLVFFYFHCEICLRLTFN